VERHGDRIKVQDCAVTEVDAGPKEMPVADPRILAADLGIGNRAVLGEAGIDVHYFFTHKPAIPRGRYSVTRMNSSPNRYSQYSGNACVNQLLPRLTTAAPMTGPMSVPRPPTAVQIA